MKTMPVTNDREYRHLAMTVRAREDAQETDMRVHGYATTFNEPYELYRHGKYVVLEQVDPHAFDECDLSDVIMQFDHAGRVYARTRNNTLTLSVDSHGLAIEADLSKTDSAKQLYEEIREGMVDRMSYGFIVAEDEWTVNHDRDSGKTTELRTIRKVRKVFDVSAVSIPANDGTSLATRTLCDGVIAKHEAERLRAEQERAKLNLRLKMMGV
ncbi:MAG: HK97 family phage prohead protease [Clostridia bacterium]|nr:HK97 family phage prohead protease [Clostridia bacterium]